MSEYIRKEDVKDALQEKVFHNLTDEFYGAMQVLDELEPADVAPVRRGKWFDSGSLSCRCDQCGCKNTKETPFCPFCGAKMDGGKNG